MNQCVKPGNLPAHNTLLQRIIHMTNYNLETEFHILSVQLIPFGLKFREGQILE
jgi:hypothetical protein